MPARRHRPRKNMTLDAFLGSTRRASSIEEKQKTPPPQSTPPPPPPSAREEKKTPSSSGVEEIIEDLLSVITTRKTGEKKLAKKAVEKSKEARREEREAVEEVDIEKLVAELGEVRLPTGKLIDIILEKGLGTEDVRCDEYGRCSDGINVGEIFTDKYGFQRQRGYLRTTRIPVYTDWIVEEAVVTKILPKAHKLVTNRGAVALVPEDFLCELQERYGVILKNYDKCKNKPTLLNTPTNGNKNIKP